MNLQPGERILYTVLGQDVAVEILRAAEPNTDRFGRADIKYWARREDTSKEGWLLFGLDAITADYPPRA